MTRANANRDSTAGTDITKTSQNTHTTYNTERERERERETERDYTGSWRSYKDDARHKTTLYIGDTHTHTHTVDVFLDGFVLCLALVALVANGVQP